MARTFVRQDTQIRNSDLYDDTVVPSVTNYETNPTNIEEDLSSIRSQLQNFLNRNGGTFPVGNWWDDTSAPVTFENGAKRGINTTNQDLHDLERKRVLVEVTNLNDVTVPATQNFVVLSLAQVPSNTTAAVGAVATRGSVVASIAGSFAAFSLVEVSGTTPISPKNICEIVDGATRDPILSSGRVVWGLLQSENATDGFTITGTTPNRVQLSFVRINAAGDDLEAVTVADIEGKIINYANVERKALDDLNEQDFLRGATLDVAASTSTLHADEFTTAVPQGQDEVFGTVTGLSPTPVKVVGYTIYEVVGALVPQSGARYTIQPYEMTSDGFKWRLTMGEDEYWPGPGPVSLQVFFVWSET